MIVVTKQIDPDGRMVIPKAIRDAIGAKAGSKLDVSFDVDSGTLVLRLQHAEDDIVADIDKTKVGE